MDVFALVGCPTAHVPHPHVAGPDGAAHVVQVMKDVVHRALRVHPVQMHVRVELKHARERLLEVFLLRVGEIARTTIRERATGPIKFCRGQKSCMLCRTDEKLGDNHAALLTQKFVQVLGILAGSGIGAAHDIGLREAQMPQDRKHRLMMHAVRGICAEVRRVRKFVRQFFGALEMTHIGDAHGARHRGDIRGGSRAANERPRGRDAITWPARVARPVAPKQRCRQAKGVRR
mmetsp:Transcript_1598/g.4707  ORF Transcript_1598/g.4707 Transcript_1598/m.4707 type:complete len:232 (+) Transcript_1598:1241-1936(+)